jgi:hypothetical protein
MTEITIESKNVTRLTRVVPLALTPLRLELRIETGENGAC